MKIPPEQRDELIEGILNFLGPAVEPGKELITVTGTFLINENVTRDVKGQLILPGTKYLYPIDGMVDVDHRFKLAAIIDAAPDLDTMNNELAEYLSKYAKSKEQVINFNKEISDFNNENQ